MRPGLFDLVRLLPALLLAVTITSASPPSSDDGYLEANCESNTAVPGHQCRTAASALEPGGMSAMVLLQRQATNGISQASHLEIETDGLSRIPAKEQFNGNGSEATKLDGNGTGSEAKKSETDRLPAAPVSLMSLAQESKPRGHKKVSELEDGGESDEFDEIDNSNGRSASLNQKGYKAVSKKKSTKEMEAFIRRVIADSSLYILDEGALKGLVPYYSGAKATQSFKALKADIEKAAKGKKKGKNKSWLSRKEPKAPKEEVKKDDDEEGDEEEEDGEESEETAGIEALAPNAQKRGDEDKKNKQKNKGGKQNSKADAKKKKRRPVKGDKSLVQIPEISRPESEADFEAEGGHDDVGSAVDGEQFEEKGAPQKRRQWRDREALVQTYSHSQSSSASGWVGAAFEYVNGQAAYWLGARVTLVACAGSLLFGLFLFDESQHRSRATAFAEAHEDSIPMIYSGAMGTPKDGQLTDLRRDVPPSLRPKPSTPAPSRK